MNNQTVSAQLNQKPENAIILHIDVNSAYLSWSALKLLESGSDVDLRKIPAIVGGDQQTRHGVVVAKSIPARAYGIHTADTVASAFKKCPTLVSVVPEFDYYREKSRRLMEFLSDICPRIEQVSIDECYMDYEPIRSCFPSPEAGAAWIKDKVYETFGFTVNVGVSDRKVLAKMASDFKKPNLVHTLYASEIQKKLWPLPIGTLHMCGKSSAGKLMKMGIRTIGDLAQTDPKMAELWLKSHGRLLWNYANGIDPSPVKPEKEKAKGIGSSMTLSEDAETREDAFRCLKTLAESVSGRLQKHHFTAEQISTEIRYATFRSVSHQMTLQSPTSDCQEIYQRACGLFDELWDGSPVRLLGIRTTKLHDVEEPVQMNLFDYQKSIQAEEERKRADEIQKKKDEKRKRADKAMKEIREKFGADAMNRGF